MISLFESLESNVRYYCRDFSAIFRRAEGPFLFDDAGRRYTDFLCGAGSLNYGHNHPLLKRELLGYLQDNGIIHSLDLYTEAKYNFIKELQSTILAPRGLSYKLQFTGPTGTNVVEAALKLARKVTGRRTIVAFTNAYHGVSLGALAATASAGKRLVAGVPLEGVIRLPYHGFLGAGVSVDEELRYMEAMLCQPGCGIDMPAAFILETVQGEGGLQAAPAAWLSRVGALAKRVGALVIVDDIQTGCGRTGTFFSTEGMQIVPDIICLSKSISGFGLPLSVLLLAPEHDVWSPGEHNGTFRGNNLAFVTGHAALSLWRDADFLRRLRENIAQLDHFVRGAAEEHRLSAKGRGMIRGLALPSPELAQTVKEEAFRRNLIVETCGPTDAVIKLLPPLTISAEELAAGLEVLASALTSTLGHPSWRLASSAH